MQISTNLHKFLKTKKRILKIAKKSALTNNWNDTIKNNYENFGEDFTIKEFHGLIWTGVHLFGKTKSTLKKFNQN